MTERSKILSLVLTGALLCGCGAAVDSTERCSGKCDGLANHEGISRQVRRVLIVPMMREYYFSPFYTELQPTRSGAMIPRWEHNNRSASVAATMAADYYRQRGAEVIVAQGPHFESGELGAFAGVWTWQQYYQLLEGYKAAGLTFDRVLFLGHGGWDGPMMNNLMTDGGLSRDGSQLTLQRTFDRQPGIKVVHRIQVDAAAQPDVAAALEQRQAELMHPRINWDDTARELSQLASPDPAELQRCLSESRCLNLCSPRCQELLPPPPQPPPCTSVPNVCWGGYSRCDAATGSCLPCPAGQLDCNLDPSDGCEVAGTNSGCPADAPAMQPWTMPASSYPVEAYNECHEGCMTECTSQEDDLPADSSGVCVNMTAYGSARYTSTEEVDLPSFERFAASLRDIVAQGGMVFLGHCNSASPASASSTEKLGETGSLNHLSIHGGPHDRYIDLLADATGRHVAGILKKFTTTDASAKLQLLESGADAGWNFLIADPG